MNYISDLKKILRLRMLEKRKSMTKELVQSKSKVICNEVIKFLSKKSNMLEVIVAAYWPLHNEVDIKGIFPWLLNEKYKICLPMKQQQFSLWRMGDELYNNGKFLEPCINDIINPRIVFVPLIAFDKDKNRLGYGSGFYDQFFSNYTVVKIGVAYSWQQISNVPIEFHDCKLDYVITENKIFL